MKHLKLLLYLLAIAATLASCGDSSDPMDEPDNKTTQVANANKNTVTTDQAVTRLEFPKLKGGNSIVIVYRTDGDTQYDSDCVNYAVEWDGDKKSQRWSCYQMHNGYTGDYSRVVDGYLDDDNVPSGSKWEQDYIKGSGFDHGHICPNADRKYSYEANRQTFYLTNMQPQYKKFNGFNEKGDDKGRGLWVRLEETLRGWTPSAKSDTLYVCKGGTIDQESDILKRIQGKLIVPKYFFVACLMKSGTQYRAIGFFMEQKNEWGTTADLADYAMSIDDLEKRTGIDFFCNLPDDTENDVEKSFGLLSWGLK